MAVDVTIDGKLYVTESGYSVQEDSTPLSVADSSGGVGQFTVTVPTPQDASLARRFRDKKVELADGSQGTTTGTTRQVGGDDSTTTLTVDSRLAALVVNRTVQPYVGTLGGYFTYLLGLCSITTGIVIDSAIASIPVTVLGWTGSVWDGVKRACAAHAAEVSLVSDNVVLRAVRQRTAVNYRDAGRSWNVDATQLTQAMDVFYYQSAQQGGALAYPLGGWNSSVNVLTVDAGTTQTVTLPLAPSGQAAGLVASLTSIAQPVAVDSVDRYYSASSVYTITGKDGLPYRAAQWVAGGGSITAKIGVDTRTIELTIQAPRDTQYAPYSIAMSSGPSNTYSSLRLVGSGVFSNRQILHVPTGVSADRTSTTSTQIIDNEHILSQTDAYFAVIQAIGIYASSQHTITVTTTGINRVGDNGSYRYPTVGDANNTYAGKTVADMNALYAGMTVGDVDAVEAARVSADFTNQAFGNIAGARVFLDDSAFRIRTAPQIGPDVIQYTAERDVTCGDVNTAFAGMTVAQVNAIFAGFTVGDYNSTPLRNYA